MEHTTFRCCKATSDFLKGTATFRTVVVPDNKIPLQKN